MSDFPVHWHELSDLGPVACPMSVLDCDQPECQRKADIARRGTYYQQDYIERRLQQAKDDVQRTLKDVTFWEVILEAKKRATDD